MTATSLSPTRTRLHITPFNAQLFTKIVPDSAKASASDISYHGIETFPERGFGYIELPKSEAEKLKKKLHGATLKGVKMRVEEARPVKKRKSEGAEEEEKERVVRKKAKREKKEKARKEDGVLPGYELEEGRHVKRGWTDGKEVKDKRKDKKGDRVKVKEGKGKKEPREGKKVAFKTAVPPNAMPIEEKADSKRKDKKAKREKVAKTPKVVQEFAKTRKPTGGLMDADAVQPNLTYEEGKGWVDEDGDVVEPEPPSKKRRREKEEARRAAEEAAEAQVAEEKVTAKASKQASAPAKYADSDSDSSDSVSSDMSSSDSSSDEEEEEEEEEVSSTTSPERPAASTVKTTPPPKTQRPREIHPLEALYKRAPPTTGSTSEDNKPSLQPLNTTFSFFNTDDMEASDAETPTTQALVPPQTPHTKQDLEWRALRSAAPTTQALVPPQTPHTKQDLEWRALRSAAPTPDTAAIGRKFSFPFATGNDDDDDDEEAEDEEMADADVPALKLGASADGYDGRARQGEKGLDGGEEKGESEFRKWFFEHRGDNNRAWKKKRREGKKLVRQRENRRLSRRVV